MTCRTLSRTRPSHIVRNISTASVYGIAYSNSVRIGPRLRLFSVIVALESAMRTLALFPLLLAISPSRIRTRLNGHHQLPKIILGIKFTDGIEVVRSQAQTAAA